ncbi:hypothetical protein AMJ40_05790 [candidate division TA06 bacterium DG_26]|uniref:AAA+ ATPase domain-containing protein n=1 Tax=candidate division TA06 bacterium DG_26 TaxID=1703771 RepID=A0A0S7WGU9_UNCT6|nr:MAG: hypothetical protein AMJ40_05790 [candidate division TA06 bacterium DG_26]
MKGGSNILITGSPGVGKTTVIQRVLREFKIEAGGFYTQELRIEGRRVGFELCTLEGKKGVLAHTDMRSTFRVGKYGVDPAELERLGVEAVSRAIEAGILVVIDEIGKMELHSRNFREKVIEALDSSSPVLATIGPQPLPFLQKIKSRHDVALIEVTRENRNLLVNEIGRLIRGCA